MPDAVLGDGVCLRACKRAAHHFHSDIIDFFRMKIKHRATCRPPRKAYNRMRHPRQTVPMGGKLLPKRRKNGRESGSSSKTGWPFRRNGHPVPAQRHRGSGATPSPFRRNGIAVPAQRHRRSGATRKTARTKSKRRRATKGYANASPDGFACPGRHPAGKANIILPLQRQGRQSPAARPIRVKTVIKQADIS